MNEAELTRAVNTLTRRVTDLEAQKVIARYNTAAGQVIVPYVYIIVNFETRVYDTHKAVKTSPTWRFTAPATDYYAVNSAVLFDATTEWVDDQGGVLALFKNGIRSITLDRKDSYGSALDVYMSLSGKDVVYLKAGDTVDIRVAQASNNMIGMLQALPLFHGADAASYNYVSIRSIK